MAEHEKLAELSSTQSVSALGLRWAALRGMLNSPLITTEEQRALRDELLVELATLEQDFSTVPSRNAMEISAKVDVAKSVLRDKIDSSEAWMIELLESIQSDLQNVVATAPASQMARPTVNFSRSNQSRAEETEAEATTPSAA